MIDFKKKLEEWIKAGRPDFNLTNEGDYKMVDANKLSKLSAMWKKVVPIAPSFSNVPDGDYLGDLKEMKLADAKKSGRLQVEMTFEIADGEYEGKTCKRFDGVEEETGMGYFKNLCEVIGFDIPDDMTMWQEHMDAFVGDPNKVDLYDITIKTNDKYANVYVNGVSDFTKGEAAPEGEAVEEEAVVTEEEEEVIEEVVEEVEQQVVVPTRKTLVKPVAKVAAQVVRQPAPIVKKAVTQPIKKVAQPVVTGGKKIVSLQRK